MENMTNVASQCERLGNMSHPSCVGISLGYLGVSIQSHYLCMKFCCVLIIGMHVVCVHRIREGYLMHVDTSCPKRVFI